MKENKANSTDVIYNEEFFRSIDVHEILPQQEPFVMISTLVHYEKDTAITETLIKEENLFVDNGFFSGSGMIENIAQTCAARIGFYNIYILHCGVEVGFIGAVSKYEVRRLAPVGSTIVTRIDIQEEIFGMSLAKAVVTLDGEIIASAELKLAVRPARPENQN